MPEVYGVSSPLGTPFFWGLLANRPTIEDGQFVLPCEPGFGWVLDKDFIAQNRTDRASTIPVTELLPRLPFVFLTRC